jgi:hypothetical protein
MKSDKRGIFEGFLLCRVNFSGRTLKGWRVESVCE